MRVSDQHEEVTQTTTGWFSWVHIGQVGSLLNRYFNTRSEAIMKQFILLGLIALASSGSQDAIVYYGRGLAKSTKGDQDGAIADFSQAIELNPKLAEAYLIRGGAKQTKGDLEGAIADENQAIELNTTIAE